MMQVFKQAFTKMYMKEVKTSLEYAINGTKKYVQGAHERLKQKKEIEEFFSLDCVTKAIENSLATGNWGKAADGSIVKTGVA